MGLENPVGKHGETIGRSVHYARPSGPNGKVIRVAAVVVGFEDDGTTMLHVFSLYRDTGTIVPATFEEDLNTPGCWSWPPRVP